MTLSNHSAPPPRLHAGPNPAIVATVYSLLFLAGLLPVAPLGGKPGFPNPTASLNAMEAFFQARAYSVLVLGALQFAAAIPLGIFTATVVSRLRFLGIRATGVYIALFGGFAAAFNLMATGSVLWVMSDPTATQASVLHVLYGLAFAFGGPGFTVPFGLLIAGVSVTAGFAKLLPKWVVIFGLVLAAAGELSWLVILLPWAVFLIPFTRFPGFVWMIAAGFLLPNTSGKTTE
jgi:hypothetical protein